MADVIEVAKTGRAKCRRCGETLGKGALRFGEEVDNAFGEGKTLHWFHLPCAAEKRPEKLGVALREYAEVIEEREQLERIAEAGAKNPNLALVRRAERAPSGRARCQQCHEVIAKDTLRVAIEREDELAMAAVSFVHLRCAVERLGLEGLASKLRRVSTELSEADFAEIEREIGPTA